MLCEKYLLISLYALNLESGMDFVETAIMKENKFPLARVIRKLMPVPVLKDGLLILISLLLSLLLFGSLLYYWLLTCSRVL